MNKKRITLLIIVALTFSAFPISLFPFVIAEPALPDYEPMLMGPEFRETEFELKLDMPESTLKTSDLGDIKMWLTLDDYFGYYFFDNYVLMAEGPTAEIWVQEDMSWPEGDPRADPLILQEQLDYLLDEFENNIVAKNEAYFGTPDEHDGSYSLLEAWGYFPPGYYSSSEGKKVVMVSNVRDESYYNPGYSSYIAGFYSSTYQDYFDRNIINIDCYDWIHRIGPEGHEWVPGELVTRPNLYESIIAHEYQHLIHDDYVTSSVSWMNEACSLFAEPLCGYELDLGQVEWFLATPDNSLTEWGDQGGGNILADYGAAFLWALFLTDHYGIDFMGRYVQQGIAGFEGVNRLLPKGRNFDQVFRDWRIANLLQTDHGKYGYRLNSLRKHYNPTAEIPWEDLEPLKIHPVSGPEVLWTSAVVAFETTLAKDGWDTGIAKLEAYGTDYIKFTNVDEETKFFFDGDEYGTLDPAPYETWVDVGIDADTEWWSGHRDLSNSIIATQVDVPENNPYLELYTYWDIEDYWDFGFVQVSDTGDWDDWTSLENAYTTDDHDSNAHPDVLANLPGLTGWSGDYVTITFDLSAYAGDTIYIGFRYVTDWATLYGGWYLDEVLVKGDGVELDIIEDLEFFYPPNPEADFTVDLVYFEEVDGELEFDGINKVKLSDLAEYGTKFIDDHEIVIAVVSSSTGLVDYQFALEED